MILAALASLVIMAEATPIPLDQPPRDYGDNCPRKRVYLEVATDGALLLDRSPILPEKLSSGLKAQLAAVPSGCDHTVYILANPEVRYGRVLQTIGLLGSLGFEQVGFILFED